MAFRKVSQHRAQDLANTAWSLACVKCGADLALLKACIKFNFAKAQAVLLMSRDPYSSVRSEACPAIANIKASLK